MRALPVVLVVCLSAACERTRLTTVADAGLICDSSERLVNGQCRVVCNRDGDCAVGQRCNLLEGKCEARPAPVDAGVPVDKCTGGAVRCSSDNKAVQTCGDAGVFVTTQTCPEPDGYCQNERCVTCRPGSTRCAGASAIEICSDDGTSYRAVTCAAGAS